MRTHIKKTLFTTLTLGYLTAFSGAVQASVPPETTTQSSQITSEADQQRKKIEYFLVSSGVDETEAKKRVASLTEDEVNDIIESRKLASMPAGGDSTITIGVGTAILIGLLLLLL